MRLLIDEHLSPRLVQWVAELGVYALSVPHAGLGGKSDAVLWHYAFQHDLTVVTTNARDFIELLDVELHPGSSSCGKRGSRGSSNGGDWSPSCGTSSRPSMRISW